MRPRDHDEVRFIEQICREIESKKSLGKEIDKRIEDYFGERSHRALNLIEKGSVKRYLFKPSGRVIWEVKGRKSTYQVMPNTNFCSCDDYYFRVMNSKKQLCYHIIAQRIASALGRFERDEHHDRDYGKITRKWKKTVR